VISPMLSAWLDTLDQSLLLLRVGLAGTGELPS
jgi:hypothetical protein